MANFVYVLAHDVLWYIPPGWYSGATWRQSQPSSWNVILVSRQAYMLVGRRLHKQSRQEAGMNSYPWYVNLWLLSITHKFRSQGKEVFAFFHTLLHKVSFLPIQTKALFM